MRPSRQRSDDELFVSQLRNVVTKLARAQRAHGMVVHNALPFSLMSILSTLERNGPMRPTELAEAEGVRKPSMTRALGSLLDRGFVTRADDPGDGRQSIVEISSRGLKELLQTREVVTDWYLERLSILSPDERQALNRAIGPLTRLAEEAP